MRPKSLRTFSLLAAAVLLLVVPTSAVGASARSGAATPHAKRLRPGMTVSRGGVGAEVPPAGMTVWTEALEADGDVRTMRVQTRVDGTVVVDDGHGEVVGGAAARAGTITTAALGPCRDPAYSLVAPRWQSTFRWYYNNLGTPSNMSTTSAVSALRAAINNITQADNSCGLADRVSATASYQGTTSTPTNINSNSTCGRANGRNVVGFGDLAATDIAFTCYWATANEIVQADVRINKVDFAWSINVPAVCTSRFIVEAVATHEFGHAFGLGHVSEALHPALTMSPTIFACQNSESTLGLGDVRGLEAKY